MPVSRVVNGNRWQVQELLEASGEPGGAKDSLTATHGAFYGLVTERRRVRHRTGP